MGAALGRVYVVGEGKDVFRVGIVILHRHLHRHILLEAFDVDGFREEHFLVFIDILDKLGNAALKVVDALIRRVPALITDHDADAPVQEGHFPHAHAQGIKAELRLFLKHAVRIFGRLDIRPEADGGPCPVRLAHDFQIVFHLAAIVFLLIDPAVLIHRHHKVAGQSINNRSAYAMQAPGHLIAFAAELAAGVQHGQADLDRGPLQLGVHAHREAAAVILHLDGTIFQQADLHLRAVAGQRLINGIIYNLIYAVVQAVDIGGADIHAGPLANGLQPFQHLYLVFIVMRVDMGCHRAHAFFVFGHCFPRFLR